MKRFTLLLFAIVFTTLASAQQTARLSAVSNSTKGAGSINTRGGGGSQSVQQVPFYTEDFAGGIPAGWTNVDLSGNNILWEMTLVGASANYTATEETLSVVGTSAANGYMMIDSDFPGSGTTEDAVLTSLAIDCSGHSSVHLSFNEYFVQYLTSTGTVLVSNDNVTFTDVYHADAGLSQDEGTPDPHFVDLDISAIAANQPTVYIQFNYHGEWDYWWFVDDVQLFEPAATDLSANSIETLNNEYTQIPLSQANSLSLSAEVKNVGGAPTTGGNALYEVIETISTSTVFTDNTTLGALSPGATQTITPSGVFTPATPGSYKARLTISIAGDGNAANDVIESAETVLSDSVYARDDDTNVGSLGIGAGPGQEGIIGQNFMVNSANDLTSVSFFLTDLMNPNPSGSPMYITVHPQASSTDAPAAPIATSETLMVMPGTIPTGGSYFTVAFPSGPLWLLPGLYYLGLHEDDSLVTLGRTVNIFTPGAVWVHWLTNPDPGAINLWSPAENFNFDIAYQLRANFGNGPVGVPSLSANEPVSIYPNPSSGMFALRFDDKSGSHAVTVTNTLGQMVYNEVFNNIQNASVDLSGQPAGIFNIRINSSGSTFTKTVLISGN